MHGRIGWFSFLFRYHLMLCVIQDARLTTDAQYHVQRVQLTEGLVSRHAICVSEQKV